MTSEHIYRDWTGSKKSVIRPDEKIAVEIFSYDHDLSREYLADEVNMANNCKLVNHRAVKCIESKDNYSAFVIDLKYIVEKLGEYRIDIFYENKSAKDYVGEFEFALVNENKSISAGNGGKIKSTIASINALNKKLKTVKQAKAKTTIKEKIAILTDRVNKTHRIMGDSITFDGEKNFFKRKSFFEDVSELGTYKLSVELPVNCYFVGAIIRRVITFAGDNIQSKGTTLQFTECDIQHTDMLKPSECKFNIGYSQLYDNPLSSSGFYFDYNDEVNVYIKPHGNNSDDKMVQRFGGYLSSVILNEDRTQLDISCADRLQAGENRFILDSLLILNGTTSVNEMEYYNPINFNSYGQVLKWLCSVYEETLKSNIGNNYLVQGEKYSKGYAIRFGKKKDVKKVSTINATAKVNNNFITVRNNSSGKKAQAITLFNTKKPVDITKLTTFHITYGLGDPKTEKKNTTIEKNTSTSTNAGSQKWGKCGVSQDGNYVMGIGQYSGAKGTSGLNYNTIYKTVFKNYCPHCGQATLRWDSGRSDTHCITCGGYSGSKRTWGDISETEISCNNCCADYDAVTGYEKDSPWKRLTKVGKTVVSSKAEQNKLHAGNMVAVAKGGETVTPENALKSVAQKMKQYSYEQGVASSYSEMKRAGKGDCHAFSDGIFTELKKLGVSCRIYEYNSGVTTNHRSVVYLDANNKWRNFPYKKYGLSKILYATSGLNLHSTPIKSFKGGNISVVKSNTSTSTTTSTVTTTRGYDKDKPPQFYIELTYSTKKSANAKKYKLNLDFTLKAGTVNDLSGLPTIWVNNSHRQASVDLSRYFTDNVPNQSIYLHSIRLVAPKIKTKNSDNSTNWYTYDKSTHDNSSCKMDIYQIIFDDKPALNPTDLQSCGKSINDIMEDIVKDSKYLVSMEYAKHRKDDKIIFRINDQTEAKFIAQEGDDNNILEWSNISYTPVTSLRNKSVCVFKNASGKYQFVDTSDISSILRYGEQTTLQTISEQISSKEAYFNARNTDEYNPEHDYSYTIVVPFAPNLGLNDLVQVLSNSKKLNDIKPIKSLHITYKHDSMPKIRTEIGLDELEPYLRIKSDMQKLRQITKQTSTNFSSTATEVTDEDIYIWD